MDRALLDRVARAVLYEGYMLYPYRPSSLKNARRCTFGTLYPGAWVAVNPGSDRWYFQMECLLMGGASTRVSALVRFLHCGIEREVPAEAGVQDFTFDGGQPVTGEVTLRTIAVADDVLKLTLRVRNTTLLTSLDPGEALNQSFGSAHAAVTVANGSFRSMTDPPSDLKEIASGCSNEGVWPVLVGTPGSTDTILASPIILPDYPQIAPESPGDLFDGGEIDEILSLRILTLTDGEKAEVLRSDDRAKAILERTEALPPEHLMRLHGTIRSLGAAEAESHFKKGDRVRLRPRKRADIFDSVLEGRIAIIEAIEQDLEGNVQLAVVVEDDPGRDLGEMRQIGHRFFYSPNEVEPVR